MCLGKILEPVKIFDVIGNVHIKSIFKKVVKKHTPMRTRSIV